jgi:hypothetical protein
MVVAPRRMGRPGLLGTMARTAVVAGTATAVSDSVSRRAAQRADERAQPQYQPAQQQAATPGDTMAKIRELADMRSQGLLTDEEFAAAKAQVLGT